MRRAMMTNRPTAGPPFTVGDSATSRPIGGAGDLLINLDAPAPRAGTITSASCYLRSAPTGAARLFTGTWDGSTFTVADSTGNLTTTAGLNTFSVSLSIPMGGYIGFYNEGGMVELDDTSGGSALLRNTASPPSASLTYTGLATWGWRISVEGTGA